MNATVLYLFLLCEPAAAGQVAVGCEARVQHGPSCATAMSIAAVAMPPTRILVPQACVNTTPQAPAERAPVQPR